MDEKKNKKVVKTKKVEKSKNINLSDTEELNNLRTALKQEIENNNVVVVPEEVKEETNEEPTLESPKEIEEPTEVVEEKEEQVEISEVSTTEEPKEEIKEEIKEIVENKPKKEKSLIGKILKGLSMVVMSFLVLIGFFLVVYIIINKVAQAKDETPPLGLYTIISPSMTPTIKVYDVVFVVKKDPEEIEIGDVISYYSTNSYFRGIPITHRVIEKFNTADGIVFRAQGDANPVADTEMILSNNVVGVVRAVIPQLGRLQFFLSTKMGWIVAILIPAIGVLAYDLLKLFKLIKSKGEIEEVRKAIK